MTHTLISGEGVSLRTGALVAGFGLLAMAILAPIANFGVLERLVIQGDAAKTAANLVASPGLFRLGILGFLIVAILDVFVAWGLHIVFRPVNASLSWLALCLRMVYAAAFAVTTTDLFKALNVLTDPAVARVFDAAQINGQAMLSINAFRFGWDATLAIFACHLGVLATVMLQTRMVPRWLGWLVGIAGLGYLIDSIGKLAIPGYGLNIAAFTFIGEVLLIFWLLWRGRK